MASSMHRQASSSRPRSAFAFPRTDIKV
jgi:hypothetical protein